MGRTINILCVGGPAAGKAMRIDRHYRKGDTVLVYRELASYIPMSYKFDDDFGEAPKIAYDLYTVRRFVSHEKSGEPLEMMWLAPSDWSDADCMREMVNSYRPMSAREYK